MIELLTCLCCSLVVIVLALSAIFSAVAACAVQLKRIAVAIEKQLVQSGDREKGKEGIC